MICKPDTQFLEYQVYTWWVTKPLVLLGFLVVQHSLFLFCMMVTSGTDRSWLLFYSCPGLIPGTLTKYGNPGKHELLRASTSWSILMLEKVNYNNSKKTLKKNRENTSLCVSKLLNKSGKLRIAFNIGFTYWRSNLKIRLNQKLLTTFCIQNSWHSIRQFSQ